MSEFVVHTGWLKHTKNEMVRMVTKYRRHAENYVAFVNSFREEDEYVSGCHIVFYELDADDIVSGESVVKFMITFHPAYEEEVTIEFTGHHLQDQYVLYSPAGGLLAQSKEYDDSEEEVKRWNNALEQYGFTEENVDNMVELGYNLTTERYDIYVEWLDFLNQTSMFNITYDPHTMWI